MIHRHKAQDINMNRLEKEIHMIKRRHAHTHTHDQTHWARQSTFIDFSFLTVRWWAELSISIHHPESHGRPWGQPTMKGLNRFFFSNSFTVNFAPQAKDRCVQFSWGHSFFPKVLQKLFKNRWGAYLTQFLANANLQNYFFSMAPKCNSFLRPAGGLIFEVLAVVY